MTIQEETIGSSVLKVLNYKIKISLLEIFQVVPLTWVWLSGWFVKNTGIIKDYIFEYVVF